MRPSTLVMIIVLATAIVLSCLTVEAYTILDFVIFDGVEYLRATDDAGRPLERDDLGPEFAVVTCAIAQSPTCPYGDDASAGMLPAGTRVHAVRGYKTDFRVAAVAGDHILLYQAWRSPRAKVGSDLYDIRGRVQSIDVRRDAQDAGTARKSVVIRARPDVDALADMIERAPVVPGRARGSVAARYWLTFWLTDGTTLGRAFFPDTSELTGGVTLPPEFRATLEKHFSE